MISFPGLFNSFAADLAGRLLAAGIFLALLGFLFYRYTGGLKNSLFILSALVLGALFFINPAAQVIAFVILIVLFGILEARRRRMRTPYSPASAMVESGGIKRGLTPVETAVLLEKPLNTVVGLVLAGLLRKGVVVQASDNPIMLGVAESFQVQADDPQARIARRREIAQGHGVIIHPYEEPFLTLLENKKAKPIQTLNLVAPVRTLLRHTARRVQGYNLPETREYYQKHLGRARHDVKHADENGRGEHIRAQNFEWMLLDARVAEVYGADQPRWLGEGLTSGNSVEEWAERLMEATVASIPPEGLQVKDARGNRLAIGGRDPVRAEFFDAVTRNLT